MSGYVKASVAQGIEHRFPKPCAAGSNPAGGVCILKNITYEKSLHSVVLIVRIKILMFRSSTLGDFSSIYR